ncbi:hypothetical protein HYO27_16655 [Vibrio parahaemolyticus]|nr:hypothetical protein [Vibrio parahaemolyticus]EKB3554534.1 hypothetical protein [Vibrio parahaemolyticus]MBM4972421.1 hypothetical protein [Vibrio parahaemolyticus]HAS6856781.1 hypothetical protein [Vibrio parahaemolyticus]
MDWLSELSKEDIMWIFSGIGTSLLILFVGFFCNKNGKVSMKQKSGNNSTNYQANGKMEVGSRDDK